MNKKIEVIIITLLYLTTLYLWTLPIRNNQLPYGEADAASHYIIADYTSISDKPITTLPYYIDIRYAQDNFFKPHTLWYPPQYHMDLAIVQIFGGNQIIPFYIFLAILSSIIVLIVYFVIRELYGFTPAFLSAILLMFSGRDYWIYLWGQWPERISYSLTILILYCFYKYTYSCIDKSQSEEKPIYIYLTSLLLATSFLLHPMGFYQSIAALAVFTIFILIKERKLPFEIKHLSFAVIIAVLILAMFPYQSASVLIQFKEGGAERTYASISTLFTWFKTPEQNPGVPDFYFSFNAMHGLWTLPLLLLGIIFLVMRRKRQDIMLLAWLTSTYIILHRDVFGITSFLHRSLSVSAHIFAPLTAIGLLYLISFIKLKQPLKSYVKYALVAVFIILAVSLNGKAAYTTLNTAYTGFASKISMPQYNTAVWIRDNTDINSNIKLVGSVSYPQDIWENMPKIQNKYIWMKSVAQRNIEPEPEKKNRTITHFLIDYSDLIAVNHQQGIQKLQAYEQNLTNVNLIYNKENMRLYKRET